MSTSERNEDGLTLAEWLSKCSEMFEETLGVSIRDLEEVPEFCAHDEWADGLDPVESAREAAFFLTESYPGGKDLARMVEDHCDSVLAARSGAGRVPAGHRRSNRPQR